jgi:hypothetical protein
MRHSTLLQGLLKLTIKIFSQTQIIKWYSRMLHVSIPKESLSDSTLQTFKARFSMKRIEKREEFMSFQYFVWIF